MSAAADTELTHPVDATPSSIYARLDANAWSIYARLDANAWSIDA